MIGWKTPATRQAHDVAKWVRSPDQIDIIPHLRILRTVWRPSYSLLDVGCYAGYVQDYLGAEKYLGVDAFPEIIEAARELHPGVAFKVCDLFDLEEKADVVFCSRVLIHLPRFTEAVQKLIDCANKAVVVVLDVSTDACEKVEQGGENYYVRSFSEETVRKAFGECTLKQKGQYTSVVKWV